MESTVKKTLRSLCRSGGWSYGVFWRFDQRNSMLLTLGDAYYEEEMGIVIDNMLMQVHMLGQGIIGQAAFTGKHQWIFADARRGIWNSLGYTGRLDMLQGSHFRVDDSEIPHDFSSGVKTVAVISVEPQGVVQFGSTQEILESLEFLHQTRRKFKELESIKGLTGPENVASYMSSENYTQSGFIASLVSSANSNYENLPPLLGDPKEETTGIAFSSTNFTESTSEASLMRNSSLIGNQPHSASVEAQVILMDKPKTQVLQHFPQTTKSSNCSTVAAPSFSTWSKEGPTLTSIEQQLSFEFSGLTSASDIHARPNTVWHFEGDSVFTPSIPYNSTKSVNDQCLATAFHVDEGEGVHREPKPAEPRAFPKCEQVDDVSQLFALLSEKRISRLSTTQSDELSKAIEVTAPFSGDGCVSLGLPDKHPANSFQSTITNMFISGGKEKSLDSPATENDLFDCLGLNFGPKQVEETWDDILMPIISGVETAVSSGVSESATGSCLASTTTPRRGLFSELGLEQLLDNFAGKPNSISKYPEEQRSSTKGKGCFLGNACLSDLGAKTCKMQHVCNFDKTNTLPSKQAALGSQVGLRIDDSYSVNAQPALLAQAKNPPEESAKPTKKRARPGESTRPRPKDRQQIQDRLADLRKLIPNSAKYSIDTLLDRTIKHMLFLQSVTKHADKLKQACKPKFVGQDNGERGGATWAFEVGDQSMVCPIIVEDLSTPGQMLIEMLCENRGFFLEIAEIIRGFGLNILKGVIEVQDSKIRARFTVEANKKHITRMDVFLSLVHLLQQTGPSEIELTNQPASANHMDCGAPTLGNYQQDPVAHPISLVDR